MTPYYTDFAPFQILQLVMSAELGITEDWGYWLGLREKREISRQNWACSSYQVPPRACSSCTNCHYVSPARNGSPSSLRPQVAERGVLSFCNCAVCNPRPFFIPWSISHLRQRSAERRERQWDLPGILFEICVSVSKVLPSHLCICNLAKHLGGCSLDNLLVTRIAHILH